jgi:glutathione S-transferase
MYTVTVYRRDAKCILSLFTAEARRGPEALGRRLCRPASASTLAGNSAAGASLGEPVWLHGYRYSVYSRIARLVLLSKGVGHETVEVDPFGALPGGYLGLHPFGLVPVLSHGAFSLFETNAITRYVDRALEGPALQPEGAAASARMDQVIAVIDSYGYRPMVRQVASHGFFRALFGETSSRAEVEAGLEASGKVLAFLDGVAREGLVLTGRGITLADCHLAPMIDYFVRAEEGKAALARCGALQGWWDRVSGLDALKATDPLAGHWGSAT